MTKLRSVPHHFEADHNNQIGIVKIFASNCKFHDFFEIKTTFDSWYWAARLLSSAYSCVLGTLLRTLSVWYWVKAEQTYALSQLIYWVSKTKTFQFTLFCKKKGQCLNCENRVNPKASHLDSKACLVPLIARQAGKKSNFWIDSLFYVMVQHIRTCNT